MASTFRSAKVDGIWLCCILTYGNGIITEPQFYYPYCYAKKLQRLCSREQCPLYFYFENNESEYMYFLDHALSLCTLKFSSAVNSILKFSMY